MWPKLWPQSKYKSAWPVFHGLVILLNIFKIIWWIVGIMDQCDIHWTYQVYVGQWPIFYGPAILLHILKTIWWRNVVLGIMALYDSKIDTVKYMWVSDLYFMVHWFYLISLSDKLFLYVKKWQWPGEFVPLWALALVWILPEPSGSQGELIVYPCSGVRRRCCRCRLFTMFKHLLLWNCLAIQSQTSHGASLGRGNKSLYKLSRSHDQYGHHAHIW